jgi:hypothetical protein
MDQNEPENREKMKKEMITPKYSAKPKLNLHSRDRSDSNENM